MTLKHLLRTSIAGLSLLIAASAFAQAANGNAEVQKVDAAQQRITLKHGEIKALDLPAMTRSFRVRDSAALSRLNAGDKVRFAVEKIDGAYTVTQIEKVE
jgi:Cu/Ag efflux protein CusF